MKWLVRSSPAHASEFVAPSVASTRNGFENHIGSSPSKPSTLTHPQSVSSSARNGTISSCFCIIEIGERHGGDP